MALLLDADKDESDDDKSDGDEGDGEHSSGQCFSIYKLLNINKRAFV